MLKAKLTRYYNRQGKIVFEPPSYMKCDCCNTTIKPGEAIEHQGLTPCEDCYLDALAPVRACDPWAVHSAKSLEKFSCGEVTPTPIHSEILDILKETGGIGPADLLRRLGSRMTLDEVRRFCDILLAQSH